MRNRVCILSFSVQISERVKNFLINFQKYTYIFPFSVLTSRGVISFQNIFLQKVHNCPKNFALRVEGCFEKIKKF